MKEKYMNALTEVNAIINNSSNEVIDKIPTRFRNFVSQNMNNNYNVNLDLDKSIIEQNISKEAKSIIALIYRDYICSADKRQFLINNEIIKKQREEELKREKYKIVW